MKRIFPSILFLMISLLLFSCSPSPERPEEEHNPNNTPETPQVLEEMEEELLNLMHDLDSIEGIQVAMLEEENEKMEEDMEESYVLKSEEDEVVLAEEHDEGEEETKENGVDVQRLIHEHQLIGILLGAEDIEGNLDLDELPPADMEALWFELNNLIDELHRKWNVLEPELQKAKVDRSDIEEFEEQLDRLSLTVLDQEIMESLFHSNQLTFLLAKYRGNFDDDLPNEIPKMKFYIRESVLLAANDNFVEAVDAVESAQELEEQIRHILIKEDAEDVVQKFQLSIDDLIHELNNEDFYLTQIKAPIVIKNIMLMDETFSAH
ncbi:hypothetical protein [Alkaliphilus metalliredigens]|nr:hypothetical protein [Alkaliphilus metalliredigens]